MILFDVNVLVNSVNTQIEDQILYKNWFDKLARSPEAFGCSDLVLSAFIRIATNRRVFPKPLSLDNAIQVGDGIRSLPNCVSISPGPRHWPIFLDLCRKVNARGNLVPDAYLAALAIESGSEWISADRDYARFPGLRWRHPLDD
jgi:toxin-antitoxin system PIN domain toxin